MICIRGCGTLLWASKMREKYENAGERADGTNNVGRVSDPTHGEAYTLRSSTLIQRQYALRDVAFEVEAQHLPPGILECPGIS